MPGVIPTVMHSEYYSEKTFLDYCHDNTATAAIRHTGLEWGD
jgi:hypothetical protein